MLGGWRSLGRRARRQPAAYRAVSANTPRSTAGSNDHEVSGATGRDYARNCGRRGGIDKRRVAG